MPHSYSKPTACPRFARAVIVGESNPYSLNPDDALLPWPSQRAGARLLSLLGWTDDEYLASFWRVNLARGRGWKQAEAMRAAANLTADAGHHALSIVMLGARVASAFSKPPLATWEQRGRLLRIPHPSGLCREWSRPFARATLHVLMEPYRVRSCAAPRQEVET